MSSASVSPNVVYPDLIREAYIKPIRTVVVVDDEYPSLDYLLREKNEDEGLEYREFNKPDVIKVLNILEACRAEGRRWLVDIHDAKTVPVKADCETAPYLHQSDLVILDYKLEGEHGDGSKAIGLLGALSKNQHFNLVVIYTKEVIENVIAEVALGLSYSDWELPFAGDELAVARSNIDVWEIEDETFLGRLREAVDLGLYLRARLFGKERWGELLASDVAAQFSGILSDKPDTLQDIEPGVLLACLIKEYHDKCQDKLSETDTGPVTSGRCDGDVNWIRTNRLFITVVHKGHTPEEIPEKLLTALTCWNPKPYRLLMAKMRYSLDEQGVLAEDEVLKDRFLQAAWLKDLVNPKESTPEIVVSQAVSRHWEAIGGAIRTDVEEFATRLALCLRADEPKNVMDKHSDVEPEKYKIDIGLHKNKYICSKPIERRHLTTGHIIKFVANGLMYVCLSPACDLVPGQGSGRGWRSRLNKVMPFSGVLLEPVANPSKALKKAHDAGYVFLEIDGAVKMYSFHPNQDSKSGPLVEQLFAQDEGVFQMPRRRLKVGSVWSHDGQATVKYRDALVVAQLRYEYAINLMHRLSSVQGRVGLDYESVK